MFVHRTTLTAPNSTYRWLALRVLGHCLALVSRSPGRWSLAESIKPQEEPSAGNPHARICEGKSRMAALLDHFLIKHARYYWLLLAESHLTRRLFGSMLRRVAIQPLPAVRTLRRRESVCELLGRVVSGSRVPPDAKTASHGNSWKLHEPKRRHLAEEGVSTYSP
jgi:hypothetical protein